MKKERNVDQGISGVFNARIKVRKFLKENIVARTLQPSHMVLHTGKNYIPIWYLLLTYLSCRNLQKETRETAASSSRPVGRPENPGSRGAISNLMPLERQGSCQILLKEVGADGGIAPLPPPPAPKASSSLQCTVSISFRPKLSISNKVG